MFAAPSRESPPCTIYVRIDPAGELPAPPTNDAIVSCDIFAAAFLAGEFLRVICASAVKNFKIFRVPSETSPRWNGFLNDVSRGEIALLGPRTGGNYRKTTETFGPVPVGASEERNAMNPKRGGKSGRHSDAGLSRSCLPGIASSSRSLVHSRPRRGAISLRAKSERSKPRSEGVADALPT